MTTPPVLLELHNNGLNQLPAFLAVANHGGFTQAGRVLGISGSAVGQSIRQLEELLEVQLFIRSTRKVALTAAGEALFHRLQPATHEIQSALDDAKIQGASPRGNISLIAPRDAVSQFVVPVMEVFRQHHPYIELDITVSDRPPHIIDEGYDLTLQIGEVIEQDMIAYPLLDPVRQVVVASPRVIETQGLPQHPRELTQLPCIGWRWEGHTEQYEWEFKENDRWLRVRINSPLVVNDRQTVLQLCLADAGFGCVSEQSARPYLDKGELVSVLDEWNAPFSGWHLIYPRQRFVPQHIRELIEAIKGNVAAQGNELS